MQHHCMQQCNKLYRPIINALDGYIAVRTEKYDALWLGLDGCWLSAISFIAWLYNLMIY